jgi:phosphatidylglycerol lysyltransferase
MRRWARASIVPRVSGKLGTVAAPLISLALFVAALEVLRSELHAVSWSTLSLGRAFTADWRLAAAVVLTAANYAVLSGNDFLAFAYLRRRLPWRQIMLTSFVAYAISNSAGFAMLSGASVRYRFYTRWGVTPDELVRLIFAYTAAFWAGLFLVGGISLALSPLDVFTWTHWSGAGRLLGWSLSLAGACYVAVPVLGPRQLSIRGLSVQLPSWRIALAQITVSSLDWILAGSVLYFVMPAGSVPALTFFTVFLASQTIGVISHVPGGIGVFEGSMVVLLKPFLPPATIVPALALYRVIYYLLPLCVALVLLVTEEVRHRLRGAARLGATIGWIREQFTPTLLAMFTFLAGVVLLVSGATPADYARLRLLNQVVPLAVIEASHFLGSIVGATLLLLSSGIGRRLDAAFPITVAALAAGMLASLLKGGDFEEAVFLAIVLIALVRSRRSFDRRAAFFDTWFSPGWIVAVAGAIGASVWLALFAFKHVEYSGQLWWQFELRADVSRVLRGSVGAAVTVLLFALRRLVRHAPYPVNPPSDQELESAARAIAAQTSTVPYLVYLRDKALLQNEDGFVMYAVQRRTWAAMGDPVGPPHGLVPLVRLFMERAADFGGVPTFYQASAEHLATYADVGLTFIKLGEEALVPLPGFSLDGAAGKKRRHVLNRLASEDVEYRVIPAADVESQLTELRDVSDDWLRHRAASEKGFSLGFFDDSYLCRFPVAVMEQRGRIVAFANLWPGPRQVELSLDLMRFRSDAPREVMEGLFLHSMRWGKTEGFERFSLGMAPLSGFETSPAAPLWNRLASFLYEQDAGYNFQGLRAFKQKFDPEWQPKYLAYPGGLRLPGILADIAALVAGGYRRILVSPPALLKRP